MKKLRLGISPCPNDTFTFHAMLHSLVDTEGIDYEVDFHDIDVLNKLASASSAGGDSAQDVIKVSYAALPALTSRFNLLSSGSALGYGNGPVVVSRHRMYPDELAGATVAIPGEGTTAARLLAVLHSGVSRRKVYLFSDIATAVADGECDAGVLIHEGRFTYRDYGLQLVTDLGREWEAGYDMPIPLGGIVINKAVGEEDAAKVARAIRRSIEFAFADPTRSASFVKHHAQELSDDVRRKHISYFVNDFSLDLGERGMKAVVTLLGDEATAGINLIRG